MRTDRTRRTRALGIALALLAAVTACRSWFARPVPAPTSILIANARIFGVPGHDGLLLEGGVIKALGATQALRAQAPAAQLLDARRGWVLAGFRDSHIHMLAGGRSLESLSLADRRTLADAVKAVREFATREPRRAWITGFGWQYDIVAAGELPGRTALDAAVADRPVYLVSYDGHTGWANSRALEVAGIRADTPDPAGGRIAREADGRTPSGALLEGAMALVERALPEPGRDEKRRALERALAHCLALGITAVDDLASDPEVFELYDELARRDALPLHVSVSVSLDGDLDRYDRLRATHAAGNPRFGYLKGFVDGVIESRTAYMLQPYEQSAERGVPQIPPERLYTLVRDAHRRGFRIALHAIGDGAVRLALDTFERVSRELGTRIPHRIEHIEVVHPDDLARFAALGIVASMQPLHANPNGNDPDSGVWARNLGPARLRRSFAWRDLSWAGATLAFGSDWPVVSADPLWGLAVAITRQDARGRPAAGWYAHQKLDLEDALDAYAQGPIAEGAAADLVVLSPGVEPRRPSTLWKGDRVRYVLVSGRLRFTAPADAAPRAAAPGTVPTSHTRASAGAR